MRKTLLFFAKMSAMHYQLYDSKKKEDSFHKNKQYLNNLNYSSSTILHLTEIPKYCLLTLRPVGQQNINCGCRMATVTLPCFI